jgi:hypothetical protein
MAVHRLDPALRPPHRKSMKPVPIILNQTLRVFALATKHPGFREEREWRLFTSPTHEGISDWLHYDVETVRGIPQKVGKLRLVDEASRGITGIQPSTLLNRIIIGPCEHPAHIREALVAAMEEAGVDAPATKIWMSRIPLRAK